MTRTVKILPETSNTTLCLALTGTVTKDDYLEFFDKPLRDILDKNGFYNLYVDYVDFEGWSPEAADLSLKCLTACGPKARKAAYVNPPGKRVLLMKTLEPILKAEVRYFNAGEENEALSWIRT
jgi:hypothetical protein